MRGMRQAGKRTASMQFAAPRRFRSDFAERLLGDAKIEVSEP
jgi:hypothetical protein